MSVREGKVSVGSGELAYLELGKGPLVLCLHGFPDTRETFGAQLEALARVGYRAVAPAMRGYAPSVFPADADFGLRAIGEDVVALIDALGEQRAFVFGHDWGAVAGYVAANLAPYRIAALATAAVPHPRALRPTVAQLRRSWYFAFFQLRAIAERRVRAKDFAFIDRLWRDWSPGWSYSEAEIAPVKRAFAEPGCTEAALAYYRAALRDTRDAELRSLVFTRCAVPAMTFAGVQDGCMGIELFDRAGSAFSNGFELVRVEDAGHFLHREQPDLVNDALITFFDAYR